MQQQLTNQAGHAPTRTSVPDGSGKADSCKRWKAPPCYLDDGVVPVDNRGVKNKYARGHSITPTGFSRGH
jgi:hypothetical protein